MIDVGGRDTGSLRAALTVAETLLIPVQPRTFDAEKAAEAFIAGAGGAPEQADSRKTPVMIRFDRDLLQRVDAAAKRRGISRSAWVMYTLSRVLDAGEG